MRAAASRSRRPARWPAPPRPSRDAPAGDAASEEPPRCRPRSPSRARERPWHPAHAQLRSRLLRRGEPRARRSNPRARRRAPGPWSPGDDATRVHDILLQQADQVVRRRELDVGVQVANEAELEPLLIEVAFEVEQESLHAKLRASKGRAVADGERRYKISLGRASTSSVSAKRGDQLVGLDADVRSRKPEPPPDAVARLHRSRHGVFAAQQAIRVLHLAGRDETPDLRAVQLAAVDLEWRNDIDGVSVAAQPVGVACASAAECKIKADHPAPDVHRRGQTLDELMRRQRRELAIEAKHDRVLDAGFLDQRELFLQRRDRLRAVGRVENAARMRFEGDERRSSLQLRPGPHRVFDHVEVAEMHSVEAANRQRHPADRTCWQSKMDLQLSTFSGTKVRRRGSVWPSAMSRPSASCARTSPGPGSGRTRTARPWRTCASCSTLSLTRSISGSMTSAGSSRSRTDSGVVSPSRRTAFSIARGP